MTLDLRFRAAALLCLVSLALFARPANVAAADLDAPTPLTRTVRYYDDRELTLPGTISRVATAWEAQNAVIAMLGFGPAIVATTRFARDMPAMRDLIPGIEGKPLALTGSGDLDIEGLLHLKPQVLFTTRPPPPAQAAQLARAGIAVATFRSNSIAALVERTRITGEILGGVAVDRARRYQARFDDNVARVCQALAGLPAERRIRVYHAVGSPLSTSGRPSLNQDWMDLAGVDNVAEHWFDSGGSGSSRGPAAATVSIEQVLAADPDLIIAMRASDAEAIRQDPKWRRLRAVRDGRVLANPRGLFWWGRETTEVALQFLWLAKVAYPALTADIDLGAETRRFYADFFGLDLDDRQLNEFLSPGS